MTRHVLLAGAFGQANPGDEALLRAFVAALPDHVPIAASSAPAATVADHAIPAVHRDDAVAILRAVRHADAVAIAGGTVFKTLHPACGRRPGALLRRLAALTAAAKSMRKPLALVGVGAGRLDDATARRLTRAIVQAADLLVLRDEESATRLAAAGATAPFRVGADAAWTVLDEGVAGASPARARVAVTGDLGRPGASAGRARVAATGDLGRPGASAARARVAATGDLGRPGASAGRARVAVTGDLGGVVAPGGPAPVVVALSHLAGGAELPVALAAGLAPVAATGVPVLLQPWQPADVALGQALAVRLEGARMVPAPADLPAARDAFADARLVVGLRFHALVAAAAAGVPFVAYAHELKHVGLARRLGQPAVAPGGPLAATVLAALAGDDVRRRAQRRGPSRDAVARERELAGEGFRLLRVLVAGGRTEEAAAVDGLALRPEEWLA